MHARRLESNPDFLRHAFDTVPCFSVGDGINRVHRGSLECKSQNILDKKQIEKHVSFRLWMFLLALLFTCCL